MAATRVGFSIEPDQCDTVDWDMKWLVDFNSEKTQVVSFCQSKSFSAIHVKIDGSLFDEKLSFKMLGFSFSSKLDWRSYIVSMLNYLQEICCFDLFFRVSFFRVCSS